MSFKKIFTILALLLGGYFLFFSPTENVIKINNDNNNNKELENNLKRGELTERYFDWLKNDLGVNEQKITQAYLERFFKEVVPPQLNLPKIDDTEIKIIDSSRENLKNYLEQTAKIKILPDEKNIDYVSIVRDIDKGNTIKILKKILETIDDALAKLKAISVPPEAKNVHKKYIGLIKYMRVMFDDLNYAKEDPIKINYNMALSDKIIQVSNEITTEREKLANSLR